MTLARTKRSASARSLLWLLLVAVAFMGLTVTRQQGLGSLHLHRQAVAGSTPNRDGAVSGLVADWRARWQMQQMFGHGQLQWGVVAQGEALWPPHDARNVPAHEHDHGALERHHHAMGDDSVVALDGAAEAAGAADGSTPGALSGLSAVGTPSVWPGLLAFNMGKAPWPVYRALAFASTAIAPLLRPPAA